MKLDRIVASTPIDGLTGRVVSRGVQPVNGPILKDGEVESDTPLPTKRFEGPVEHDLTGIKFGYSIVIGQYEGKKKTADGSAWVLKCGCGKYIVRRTKSMKRTPDRMRCSYCDKVEEMKRLGYNPKVKR